MEIHISVRNLVEFLLRSGDIDNRKSGGADNAMLEGARLHRLLQSRMGAGYLPEVSLRYLYDTEKYRIVVERRAKCSTRFTAVRTASPPSTRKFPIR